MKYLCKIYFLVLLISLELVNSSFAQKTFYQNFEPDPNITDTIHFSIDSNSKRIWHVGMPKKTKFNEALSIPNVLITDTTSNYDTSSIATVLFSQEIVTSFFNYYSFRWIQKIDFENNKDFGEIYVSANNGKNWYNALYDTTMNSPVYNIYGYDPNNLTINPNSNNTALTGTDTFWRDLWLCMYHNSNQMKDTFLFKFVFYSDSVSTNNEGWMMDNFMLSPSFIHTLGTSLKVSNSFTVFPNETTGIVHVESTYSGEDKQLQKVYLYSSSGALLEEFNIHSKRVMIDISKYPDGMYILKPYTKNQSKSIKVLLKHQ